MRRFLLVGAVLALAGVVRADDKIVIINGPVIVNGNGNIVQIGNGNKVIINNGTNTKKRTTKTPQKLTGNPRCDMEGQRHDNQVAAWMALMGKK